MSGTRRPDARRSDARRSDTTKAAILAAARERFAADGYERATIRAIASYASIDPAMVMRYFGNKEGLFAAAVEFDLRLPDLSTVPRRRIGEVLVRHVLTRWEEDETLAALLRAGMTHAAAAERLRAIFAGQVRPAVAAVVADRRQADLRAGLLGTQVLGLVVTRYLIRLPPVVAMTADEIVHWFAPTVQRYLIGP
jgi:AcrR family transcriptional regulator